MIFCFYTQKRKLVTIGTDELIQKEKYTHLLFYTFQGWDECHMFQICMFDLSPAAACLLHNYPQNNYLQNKLVAEPHCRLSELSVPNRLALTRPDQFWMLTILVPLPLTTTDGDACKKSVRSRSKPP